MTQLDRRAFLTKAAYAAVAGAGAVGLSPSMASGVSLFPDTASPGLEDLGSSNRLGSYVAGQLRKASPERLLISVLDDYHVETKTIGITEATEITRQTWESTWSDLEPGDKVECGLYADRGGVPTAWFVCTNLLALWGEVSQVDGDALIVRVYNDWGMSGPGFPFRLIVTPSTRMGRLSGPSDQGDISVWSPEDYIHFTATSTSQTSTTGLRPTSGWGLMISELGMMWGDGS